MQKSKQEVTKIVSLVKLRKIYQAASIYINALHAGRNSGGDGLLVLFFFQKFPQKKRI